MKHRVLVCGSRNWSDYGMILDQLQSLQQSLLRNGNEIECIIEGGARGADTSALVAAIQLGIPHRHFPANWKRYGEAAGPIRNQQMIDEGRPTLVLAFDIDSGPGTSDMIRRAVKHKIEVHVWHQQTAVEMVMAATASACV